MLDILKKHQSLIASCIIVLAACWISILVWKHAQVIQHYFRDLDALRMLIAMASALASLFVFACVFKIILQQVSQKELSFNKMMSPYFFGQIAKYLPGKVWGVLYQAQRMSQYVAPSCVWQTNIELMILGTIQHGIVILCFMVWLFSGPGYAVPVFSFLELAFLMMLKTGRIRRGVLLIVRLFSPHAPVCSDARQMENGFPALLILFLLLLEWIFIILTWHMLLPAGASLLDTCLIASSYILAWLTGFFTFIVPNGIMIREAVFIWFGGVIGLDQGMLVYYGVLARIFYLAADILAVTCVYAAHLAFRARPDYS